MQMNSTDVLYYWQFVCQCESSGGVYYRRVRSVCDDLICTGWWMYITGEVIGDITAWIGDLLEFAMAARG